MSEWNIPKITGLLLANEIVRRRAEKKCCDGRSLVPCNLLRASGIQDRYPGMVCRLTAGCAAKNGRSRVNVSAVQGQTCLNKAWWDLGNVEFLSSTPKARSTISTKMRLNDLVRISSKPKIPKGMMKAEEKLSTIEGYQQQRHRNPDRSQAVRERKPGRAEGKSVGHANGNRDDV